MSKPLALEAAAIAAVEDAERRFKAGDISRQRLYQIRKAHGVGAPRCGAPPKPARKLKRNARGNVELRVLLPASTIADIDVLVAGPPRLSGRKAVTSHALPIGFAAMLKRPPKVHEAPAGERSASGEQGPVLEVAPAELARIDAYAAEHGTARAVVVAMAVVRGVEEMR